MANQAMYEDGPVPMGSVGSSMIQSMLNAISDDELKRTYSNIKKTRRRLTGFFINGHITYMTRGNSKKLMEAELQRRA
jgi:hypothetical protein